MKVLQMVWRKKNAFWCAKKKSKIKSIDLLVYYKEIKDDYFKKKEIFVLLYV